MPLPAVDRHFSPRLFAHGRVLYRFAGSDACRFSPKLAFGLVKGIAVSATDRPPVLWDPFSGSGLIPSIACLFFSRAFRAVVASDVAADAVECSSRNLRLVTDVRAAAQRLRQMRGLQKRNAKSLPRWGETAEYLESLMPLIEANQRLHPAVYTFRASAFELPSGVNGDVHFVGDLPYGKCSSMEDDHGVDALPDALTAAYPGSSMTLIMAPDDARRILARGSRTPVEVAPCRTGRVVLRTSRAAA
jgi:hypothetical protein